MPPLSPSPEASAAGESFGDTRTADEMAALFDEEYLTKTLEVAEKCNLELDLSTSHMPQFQTPDGSTAEEYLWRRIQEGVQVRYGDHLDSDSQHRLLAEQARPGADPIPQR